MSKEKMVTRTVKTTVVKVMCVTVSTATVSTETYTLVGTYDIPDALETVKKLYETDDIKPSAVIDMRTYECLYGMTESDFLKHSTILPPRN